MGSSLGDGPHTVAESKLIRARRTGARSRALPNPVREGCG